MVGLVPKLFFVCKSFDKNFFQLIIMKNILQVSFKFILFKSRFTFSLRNFINCPLRNSSSIVRNFWLFWNLFGHFHCCKHGLGLEIIDQLFNMCKV